MAELDNKWKKYFPDQKDAKQERRDEGKETHTFHVQKASNKDVLAESILINNKPYFLVSEKKDNGEVTIAIRECISIFNGKYRPLEAVSYVNKPYSFASEEEVKLYVERAKSEKLDSLYEKVKKTWIKYIDADSFHISICAADTLFTYFQDKIGLTHYLFFVGNAGSGKSNNLTVFQYLGYRNMTSTDISHYNIYQFFGNMDEGVGTLCEDEADNIDEQTEKMKIYKKYALFCF